MKYIGDDTYELSSGRGFYANCGVIGLTADKEDKIWVYGWYEDFSLKEKIEVAEFMVNEWKEFLKKLKLEYLEIK